MLHQLTIRNFAIIDQLQVDWQPGLNVITGETGAGKSIILNAVGLIASERGAADIIRNGDTGRVFCGTDDPPRRSG